MKRLRSLTRGQWAVVVAVTVLVAAGITVAALSLGGRGPSRPAVKLQVTNPSPAPSGPITPVTSGPARPTVTTPAAGQPAPHGTTAPPTVITPPPRAYTVSPPTAPANPAQVASLSPSPPGAVEVAKCPLNMKCTLP